MWHHTITPRTRLFVCPKVLIMATSHNIPSLHHRCFHTFNAPSSPPPPTTGCVRHLSGSSLEAVCQLQYETFLPKMDWCLLDVICHLVGRGKYTQEIWLKVIFAFQMCASHSKGKGMSPQASVHSRLLIPLYTPQSKGPAAVHSTKQGTSSCTLHKARDQQLYTPLSKGPAAVHSTKQGTSSCTLHKARDQQLYTPQSKGPAAVHSTKQGTSSCTLHKARNQQLYTPQICGLYSC